MKKILPIRIIHVVGKMNRAGAETMLLNLYREIDREKFQFDFVYFTKDRCDYDGEIEALGGHIYRIVEPNIVFRYYRLWKLLRSRKWSIIHSHTLFSSGLNLAVAHIAGMKNRVVHSHSIQDANSKTYVGRLYQLIARRLIILFSTYKIACGKAAADYLFGSENTCSIIPNAIDVELFSNASSSSMRKELGISNDSFVILQVGRLMQVKNHTRSIQIASKLRDERKNFYMLFVGEGEEKNSLLQLVKDLGLGQHILFLGLRDNIHELMADADVLFLPSLYEGFPVVLVEAQASGLPSVISSSVPKEVELGMHLVQFIDLSESDDVWINALEKTKKISVMGRDERQHILNKAGFSAPQGAKILEKIYEDLCFRT